MHGLPALSTNPQALIAYGAFSRQIGSPLMND
jgi:hypothetical protein